MAVPKAEAVLLVEGKNDQHVIWALCQHHKVEETFSVHTSNDQSGGIEKLLAGIPIRLKAARLRALGIVLDADQDIQARWQAIRHRLVESGYHTFPSLPDPNGSIVYQTGKPTVGIWVMPDNQVPGMLENFVAHLIPKNDLLSLQAEAVLQTIEDNSYHRYASVHRPKAFIHTWLAWQETPGQPMGQAITARVLDANHTLAKVFVGWLNRLFN